MAGHGRRPARGASKGAPARRTPKAQPKPQTKPKKKVVFDAPMPEPEEPRVFRLALIPGATPGKWIDAWKQRMPHVPIELVTVSVTDQESAAREADAAIVRLPLNDDALQSIPLYEEVPVVVASIDSHLMAADELILDDLVGELVMVPSDDALRGFEVPGALAPKFAPLTTADAIATAATGTGVVVMPMSLARLHHRKDADYRPLADGPTSTVALAWVRERTTGDVDTFIGIVRGRTANSSR